MRPRSLRSESRRARAALISGAIPRCRHVVPLEWNHLRFGWERDVGTKGNGGARGVDAAGGREGGGRPRRAVSSSCDHSAMAQPRSWREMYERIAVQIKRETGD